MPTGLNRGFGGQQLYFGLERLMDKVAATTGLDPAEARRRNFIGVGEFPYRTPTGGVYDSGDYRQAFDLAHIGCEHGVCGMCTVLVDGQAARSCLLFACQLDGAEVTTVEGLGRPGELHPLQQAFDRHHALQCGFCTPGFLLSAYDLLTHHPEVTDDELATELSGVLCRCTGYRNILSAVAEVARTHPDGLPDPPAARTGWRR